MPKKKKDEDRLTAGQKVCLTIMGILWLIPTTWLHAWELPQALARPEQTVAVIAVIVSWLVYSIPGLVGLIAPHFL